MRLERLVFGGRLMGYAPDGRVVFVSQGQLGAMVEVEVYRSKKRFMEATVLRTVAHADGTKPFCHHFEKCGGCPWQGASNEEQRAELQRHVQRHLATAAGGDFEVDEIFYAGGRRQWRSTTRLHWSHGVLGYHGRRANTVIEIDACPVLADPLPKMLKQVQSGLSHYLIGSGTLRLTAATESQTGTAAFLPDQAMDKTFWSTLTSWFDESDGFHGLIVREPGKPLRSLGQPVDYFGPHSVAHPAGAFVQAHQAGNQRLVEDVVRELQGKTKILELFAGSGNFTIPLAEAGAYLTVVERDPKAVDALRLEAQKRGLGDRVDAVAGNAEDPPMGVFDALLMDPPRAGASKVLLAIESLRPAMVVYVSCDPTTLARDARWLVERGWQLASARPYDLFPHTGHVETLAVFKGPGYSGRTSI